MGFFLPICIHKSRTQLQQTAPTNKSFPINSEYAMISNNHDSGFNQTVFAK
ncbi:hypothetical protein PROVALCAL_03835 [Providencia alcalifaciens DSM 30120]|uniref:Uncharacterized protein n=1 Tax=Providencia alcalifaciens DSM 30120 TaxID=520999 RepID=B6XKC5_9GAMM|nr:hypothetical protein PROVALCAL_03835 [Providencia alcalifaciens DSM 30120]